MSMKRKETREKQFPAKEAVVVVAVTARMEKFRDRVFSLRWLFCSLLLCLLLAVGIGCHDAELDGGEEHQGGRVIDIDGIAVPVFETSAEQLNYTRSWFADRAEKRAALQAFLQLFPEKEQSCGMAALDLAYLELGGDYRLSREHEGLTAIKAYTDIAADYEDIPQVSAKAYWYIGWIYADLLGKRQKGIEYYRLVAEKFPEERVLLLLPTPWVGIISTGVGAMDTAPHAPPRNTWAALALMEILRNSEDEDLAWSAFVRLWRQYRHSSATGFGLLLILERRIRIDRSLKMAEEYLKMDTFNVHIQGDIQRRIDDISLQRNEA